ncbi:MAG: hypothetical protein HC893_04205 [Chloroflexaceae bacterium]|nr:hypothetical protein [Chloroflexaceae bacterium]
MCDWFLILVSIQLSNLLLTGQWLNPLASPSLHIFSYLMLLLLWMIFVRMFDLYASKRFFSIYEDAKSTVAAVVGTLTTYSIVHLLSDIVYAINFPLTLVISLVIVNVSHYVVRIVLRFLRAGGHNQRRVLIYGAGQLGELVALNITKRPWMGLRILGFLDDDPARHHTMIQGYEVLGDANTGREMIQTDPALIDELIITLPADGYAHITAFIVAISVLRSISG